MWRMKIIHIYLPTKVEHTEGPETSAYKIQTPGIYPEESIQHSEHCESLKSSLKDNFQNMHIQKSHTGPEG
jgi:hypothetical protein